MESSTEKVTFLEGRNAIEKWLKGKESWNRWVKENPNTEICFRKARFTNQHCIEKGISFDGYHFPNGVSFEATTFGGHVSFARADFGKGGVIFDFALFANGVNFSEAVFHEGNVSFLEAQFGGEHVIFNSVEFINSTVNFTLVNFQSGIVSFEETNFGKGNVYFRNSNFGNCNISFKEAIFEGNLFLDVANFGKGKLNLSGITAKAVDIEYDWTEENTEPPTLHLSEFSLRKATLDGPLILNNLEFNCVPDLLSTRLSHHIEMSGLKVNSERERADFRGLWSLRSNDTRAQAKLRRLKELCEQCKHTQEALDFNALENQATRWIHDKSFFRNVLDMCYSAISNYGRSYFRPLLYLFMSWYVFACIFVYYAVRWSITTEVFYHMLQLSIINSLPFISIGRELRDEIFSEHSLSLIDGLSFFMGLQSIISVILLFLTGLGLRNQFRL